MDTTLTNTTDVPIDTDEIDVPETLLEKLESKPMALEIDKTQIRKDLFITTLLEKEVAGNVTIACQRTGFSMATVYYWRNRDDVFKDLWDKAVLLGDRQMMTEAEYALRKNVLAGHQAAIEFTLGNRGSRRWGKAVATVNNTQVNNINITNEKRKELNDKFMKFIETTTLEPKV